MKNRLRGLFRTRCWHTIGRGPMVYSMRAPDQFTVVDISSVTSPIPPDAHVVGNYAYVIAPGTEIAVYGSIKCHRRRWHRGEHVA